MRSATPYSPDERQARLEQLAKDAGVKRVRDNILRAKQEGRGAETPAGVALLRRAVEPLANAIRAAIAHADSGAPGRRQHAVKTLKLLEPEVSAYLAIKEVVSAAIAKERTLTNAASRIGALIEEELRLSAFEGSEPNLYNHLMRQVRERGSGGEHARRLFVFAANKYGVKIPTMTRVEKLHVGVKLIDLVIESLGIVNVVNVRKGMRNQLKAIILPTEAVRDWLDDFNSKAELLRPVYSPTVTPPRDWTGLTGGGYHTDALRPLPLVKRVSKEHFSLLKSADLTTVYNGLNLIQRTAWQVNTRILDLLREAWERDNRLALPHREDLPVPSVPDNWDELGREERKKWKMEARRVHEANATSRGRRLNVAQLIAAAEEVRHDPRIYFPHQLDFRGRAYAVPVRLNPQGPDIARALLTFADGKPINDPRAAGWLTIHGANLYGYDKASLEDRIAWVHEREDQIAAAAENPFAETWWAEADNPWTFLAWCMEYTDFLKHGYGYVSSFPVSVDGSCNGLQHFSAMLRDPIGGAAVNLTPSDKPSDIYQRVADRVIERLRSIRSPSSPAREKEEFDAYLFSRGWLAFGIDRKITKRAVMVLPYGGTFRACLKYVRDAVNEKIEEGAENPFGAEIGRATAMLASLVWESIRDVVVAARDAMDWLQKVARVVTKKGNALHWTTPSGFVAYQAYKQVDHRRVKTRLQGSLVYLSQREEKDSLDPRRQAQGISPNFVHSMDAAAMMLTIELAAHNGVSQFAVVHDSYGTVAADMDMLSACLREAFVDMYETHNVLAEFRSGLPEGDYPDIPKSGTLDIQEVRNSEFFFA